MIFFNRSRRYGRTGVTSREFSRIFIIQVTLTTQVHNVTKARRVEVKGIGLRFLVPVFLYTCFVLTMLVLN